MSHRERSSCINKKGLGEADTNEQRGAKQMTKLFSISHGKYWCECKYEEGAVNPYRLYRVSWHLDAAGFPRRSCKLVEKYADMESVLYHLATEWTFS